MNENFRKISIFIFTFTSVFMFWSVSAFASVDLIDFTLPQASLIDGQIYIPDGLSYLEIRNCTGGYVGIYVNDVLIGDSYACPSADVPIPQPQPYGFLLGYDHSISLPYSIQDLINSASFGGYFPIYHLPTPPVSTGGILFGRHYAESGSDGMATTAGSLLASVGAVSDKTFTSTFPYLMLSIGVFISFYIIQKIVIMLGGSVSREKARRGWSGEGVMEHEYRGWRKKARSRRKRGLDIE
jgi:hypothetical protein